MKDYKPIGVVSNPSKVFSNARKTYGNNVKIELSDKPEKKYKLFNPIKKNWFYFGHSAYEDYTKTQDEDKRRLFRIRNKKWADAPMYSPAFASYWLLWIMIYVSVR
jgi:hypothetical protein